MRVHKAGNIFLYLICCLSNIRPELLEYFDKSKFRFGFPSSAVNSAFLLTPSWFSFALTLMFAETDVSVFPNSIQC